MLLAAMTVTPPTRTLIFTVDASFEIIFFSRRYSALQRKTDGSLNSGRHGGLASLAGGVFPTAPASEA
jgi:hypothetical protein